MTGSGVESKRRAELRFAQNLRVTGQSGRSSAPRCANTSVEIELGAKKERALETMLSG